MSKSSEMRDHLKAAREALAAKVSENETIIGNLKGEQGGLELTEDVRSTVEGNLESIKRLRGDIELLEATLEGKDFLGSSTEASVAGAAAAAAASMPAPYRSVGEMFVESDEFKSLQGGQAGLTMRDPFRVKMADLPGRLRTKDVYSDLPTGTPSSFAPIQRDPIVPRAHRVQRVRDLFPVQTTSAAVIEYFRVSGFTNNASPVPERSGGAFGSKPQSTLAFVGEQAVVRTIAHWEAAHRNVLADVPQLRGIIDSELLYGLQLREDQQILSGAGTSEDLLGILNTSGVQTYSWSAGSAGDNKADAVRRALTLSFLAYYQPTGVVVHPGDWEDMELIKSQQGEYLLATAVAVGAEPRIWQVPVIQTPAIAEGTALVGAFGLGAQLYDREDATVRVAEQHSDFFIRNAVVVLAEERLALATKRPESFVKVTFDMAPS